MAKKAETISVNYNPEEVDLKQKLGELKAAKGSRFEGRSLSEIAKMGLAEWLEEELAKHIRSSASKDKS